MFRAHRAQDELRRPPCGREIEFITVEDNKTGPPDGSVLDKKMHARHTGVPGHLAYMLGLAEGVMSPLYAHAKWHGAAGPPRHQGSKKHYIV